MMLSSQPAHHGQNISSRLWTSSALPKVPPFRDGYIELGVGCILAALLAALQQLQPLQCQAAVQSTLNDLGFPEPT